MKNLFPALAVALVVLMASCGNKTKKVEETVVVPEVVTVEEVAPVETEVAPVEGEITPVEVVEIVAE